MIDAPARVDGSLDFALNAEVPGMLHARLVRSPYAHARITSLDVSAAENLPGVRAVLTAADFARPGAPALRYGLVIRDQPVVCDSRVRFCGDPVAAVAADTEAIASAALNLIEATYEELPHVTTIVEAIAEDAVLIHEIPAAHASLKGSEVLPRNSCGEFHLRCGDVVSGFARADIVVDGTYESPVVQHVPMEPHVAIAYFEQRNLRLLTATQAPFLVRDLLCEMFDLPSSAVRVSVPPIGGAFGSKSSVVLEPVAAALAWKCGRPVKVVLPRDEEFVSVTKHGARITMRTGVARDGTVLARQVTGYLNAGAYADISPRVIKASAIACVGPYRIPNVDIIFHAINTNLPSAAAYRGYGVPQGAWAAEQQMDELAEALHLDAVALRERNLLEEGEQFATGEIMEEVRWKELLSRSAEAIDWSTKAESHDGVAERARGKGIAVIAKSTRTPSASHAAVRLDNDGTLQVFAASVEMGQGAHTVIAQMAADALGINVESVNITRPDTQYAPYDEGTFSSRSTRAVGSAVTKASRSVRAKLNSLSADILEASSDDIVVSDGRVWVIGSPQQSHTIGEIMRKTRTGSIVGDGEVVTTGGLDENGQGVTTDHWHQGAAGVEVEVDLGTGKVYVDHLYVVVYVGRAIHPKLAKLQMHGSAFFGIGHALYEELLFDNGVATNPNLAEYSIMGIEDVPRRLEVELLEDEGAVRIHGLGETAMPPVIAAIGNAVANATGRRVRRLPITPERVLQAMGDL
jgi:CO/xanthine dehydrogenase Mo-binding subunit